MLIAQHVLAKFHPIEKAPVCRSVREKITLQEKKTIPLRAKFLLIKSMRAPVCRAGAREGLS